MSVGARNLHRIAGALDRARREALAGKCGWLRSVPGCDQPAAYWVESWTGQVAGVCTDHAPLAREQGYTLHATLED